jgi:hypothetical protein
VSKVIWPVVCGALLLLWVQESCEKPAPPVVVPDTALVNENRRLAEQHRIDSIAAAQLDSINAALKVFAESQTGRRRLAEQSATALRARADSALLALETAVTASDSIPPLIEAHAAQKERGDSLSSALSSEKQAHMATAAQLVNVGVSLRRAEIRADSALRAALKWESDSERIARLANAAEKKLRAFPNRTEMGLIGTVFGAGLMLLLANASN